MKLLVMTVNYIYVRNKALFSSFQQIPKLSKCAVLLLL